MGDVERMTRLFISLWEFSHTPEMGAYGDFPIGYTLRISEVMGVFPYLLYLLAREPMGKIPYTSYMIYHIPTALRFFPEALYQSLTP